MPGKTPAATTAEVQKYFWSNRNPKEKYDNDSLNGTTEKTKVKLECILALPKAFMNVFNNEVKI